MLFKFFIAPPEGCPIPRWYSTHFLTIYELFAERIKAAPSNVHVLPMYPTDHSMFDLDGRFFKTAFGKDYLDHLLSNSESGMVQVHTVFTIISRAFYLWNLF